MKKKTKKKFLAMVSATLLIFSSSTGFVSAIERTDTFNSNTSNYSSADTNKIQNTFSTSVPFSFSLENIDSTISNTLITHNPDGTFSKTTYDFSSNNKSGYETNVNTAPYLPQSALASSNEITSITSETDQYDRESNYPADARVGHLLANFDTDGDGDLDASYYGTASLQDRDLIISCAHIVWKPEFSHLETQGWASRVIFYAGRNASRDYAVAELCTYKSVPQNYVSTSSCSVDENGNLVVSTDKNWDWSILRVDTNLGSQYGWLGLHGCGIAEDGMDVEMIGYPGDKDFGSQWISYGTITGFYSENIMCFDAYAHAGNSGSPITNNGYVYGIANHISYTLNSMSEMQWTSSGGVRMYDDLFNIIVAEKQASAARWE